MGKGRFLNQKLGKRVSRKFNLLKSELPGRGPIKDPRGNQKMGASATTSIKRQDFGVSGFPSVVVGDDVAITLDVEMVKKSAPAP
jgi:polyisoprenoid-binding protein YceI